MPSDEIFQRDWVAARYEEHFNDVPVADRQGWSFLYSPERALGSARIGIIGLNPGGSQKTNEGRWDYAHGELAYADEPWANGELNPLQLQIASMFREFAWRPNQVVGAQLVPFRSASWGALRDRQRALETFTPLWQALLARSAIELWISLGLVAGARLAQIAGSQSVEVWKTGWGSTYGQTFRSDKLTIIALPHLSRYRLFNRDAKGDLIRPAAAAHIAQAARERGLITV